MTKPGDLEAMIERTTAESNTSDNWELILDICDRVKDGGGEAARVCVKAIRKRLLHKDPHVVLLTLGLLDSCVSNCGKPLHQEVAMTEFIAELRSRALSVNRSVAEKTRSLLHRWVTEDLKGEPSSNSVKLLYNQLKDDNWEIGQQSATKSVASDSTSASQKEAEDLAKAIQLSLKEQEAAKSVPVNQGIPKTGPEPLSYPSTTAPARVVKALYDFEAAEDNELTFNAGELITVVDDSDQNWWKGTNHRGEGLFPASFVTSDLTAEVESVVVEPKKKVQFNNSVDVKTVSRLEPETVAVDEKKLDECLGLLQDADPTGERPDSEEMLHSEEYCAQMGGIIDKEIVNIDMQHNELADANSKLMDALNMYHRSMKEAQAQIQSQAQSQYNPVMHQQQQQQQYVINPATGAYEVKQDGYNQQPTTPHASAQYDPNNSQAQPPMSMVPASGHPQAYQHPAQNYQPPVQ